MNKGPLYQHDCNTCLYLGTIQMHTCYKVDEGLTWYDLLIHISKGGRECASLVARYGDDPGDYLSHSLGVHEGLRECKSPAELKDPLEMAYQLAKMYMLI